MFKKLSIKTAAGPDITETGPSIQTDDIVHCGVSCSSNSDCSGLQFDKETKICKKMKKVDEIFKI